MDESIKAALKESLNEQTNMDGESMTDEERILSIINSAENAGKGFNSAVKWFREKHGCALSDAYNTVMAIVKKNDIQLPKPKGGCVITILVAITATLFSFFTLILIMS